MRYVDWLTKQRKMDEDWADDVEAAFSRNYDDSGCTCFISPPCSYCLHEGNPDNLEQSREDMKLNRANFAEFFRNDYYTIEVMFLGSEFGKTAQAGNPPKLYTYKVHKDVDLTTADKVLVCTSNNLDMVQELKVCAVVKINGNPKIEEDTGFSYKWIVGKFEDVFSDYRTNVEKDDKLKSAVSRLEQKLEQISLRKQLQIAMDELDPADKAELAALFGTELLLEKKDGLQ